MTCWDCGAAIAVLDGVPLCSPCYQLACTLLGGAQARVNLLEAA